MFLKGIILGRADSKKAMSAIITVVLLLLLTIGIFLVVAGWQEGFVSDLTADVQKETMRQDVNSKIEAIQGDELFFNNAIDGSRKILEVSVDGQNCDLIGGQDVIDKGMNILNISSCVGEISQGIHEVLIVTDEKVYTKSIYVRGDGSIETGSEVGTDMGHLVFVWKKNGLDVFYEQGSVVIGGEDPMGNKLRVTGGNVLIDNDLKVEQKIITGDVCIENGECLTDVLALESESSSVFIGVTNGGHNGNLASNSLLGYPAGDDLCNDKFTGAHMCSQSEILFTITKGDITTLFSG